MKLGDAFPPGLVIQVVDQSMRKGLVVRDFVREIARPKVKRFILVGLDRGSMAARVVIINSKIPGFVIGKPHLESLQAPLPSNKYPELVDHDSFINCMEIISVDFNKLRQRLHERQAQILGHLSEEDTKQLIARLLSAPTISKHDKRVLGSPLELP